MEQTSPASHGRDLFATVLVTDYFRSLYTKVHSGFGSRNFHKLYTVNQLAEFVTANNANFRESFFCNYPRYSRGFAVTTPIFQLPNRHRVRERFR